MSTIPTSVEVPQGLLRCWIELSSKMRKHAREDRMIDSSVGLREDEKGRLMQAPLRPDRRS